MNANKKIQVKNSNKSQKITVTKDIKNLPNQKFTNKKNKINFLMYTKQSDELQKKLINHITKNGKKYKSEKTITKSLKATQKSKKKIEKTIVFKIASNVTYHSDLYLHGIPRRRRPVPARLQRAEPLQTVDAHPHGGGHERRGAQDVLRDVHRGPHRRPPAQRKHRARRQRRPRLLAGEEEQEERGHHDDGGAQV